MTKQYIYNAVTLALAITDSQDLQSTHFCYVIGFIMYMDYRYEIFKIFAFPNFFLISICVGGEGRKFTVYGVPVLMHR